MEKGESILLSVGSNGTDTTQTTKLAMNSILNIEKRKEQNNDRY